VDPLVCSAKGCRAAAVWALAWNNPKLHEPERRKTWLACEQHRESLSGFLAARSFLRETTALSGAVPPGHPPSDGSA
jgi:hypothetical protein